MIIEQPPLLYRHMFPKSVWRIPSLPSEEGPSVYLTFDDGPIPEVTPWTLDVLRAYDVPATFFCVGENVWRFSNLFQRILDEGHAVGNHTYHHLQGLHSSTHTYMRDTLRAHELIQSPLFRPPHGHLTWRQLAVLQGHFQVVMWDVVTRDYSRWVTPEQVLSTVQKYTRDGSIVVFHDSIKSQFNMRYALPRAIEFLMSEGYIFKKLDGRVQPSTSLSLKDAI